METETTYSNVVVDITIDFADLEALIRDGEILAHPDEGPALGIIYDQRSGAGVLVEQYEEEPDAWPLVLSQRDLIDLLNGEPAEWHDHHPADIDATLEYEAERDEGEGPTLASSQPLAFQ
jgi:hypothetical protein